MDDLIQSGWQHIDFYGPDRAMGGLRLRVPKIINKTLSDKERALEHFQSAYEGTLREALNISVHGMNNNFYAETLLHFGRREEGCRILKIFSQQDPEALLPERAVATALEQRGAKKMLKRKCRSVKVW